MIPRVGVPELAIIFMISALWIVPLVAGVWAIFTLYKLRKGQEAMMAKLDAIAGAMRRPG